MGLLSTILSKLGLHKEKTAEAPAGKSASANATGAGAAGAGPKATVERQKDDVAANAPASRAISEVDVVKMLETKAKGSGLDWKVSIVDLLKVLDIDSSKDARIGLAKELGCPADLIGGDYSKMNVWLHKAVLKKIAENGGNIPASMLD